MFRTRFFRNHGFFGAVLFSFIVIILLMPFDSAWSQNRKPVDLSTAIVQVAKRTIPAVVHIEVTGTQEVAAPSFPFENDPFFRQFFGAPKGPRKFKRELRGVGTGMIIDTQGHIVTNYHVAGGASKIDVLFANGKKYSAKLIGSDPKTDLAVLKIVGNERFPFIAFGDSDKTEVGEWVVAIGHPRGLDQTVTQGIISAKHRRGITDPNSFQDFIQTDAAINPGNSGGPLLNLQGEVIGVNAVIISSSGGYEGIGFAIPSNIAIHVARTLIAHGKVERGWLGVTSKDVTSEQAKVLGMEALRGAFIVDVVKGGPADKGGLKKNDVVIALKGKEIRDAGDLRNEVANTPIGSEIKVTVLRNGKKQDFTIKSGDLRVITKTLAGSVKQRLGVEVRPPLPRETTRYGIAAGQGVVVTKVDLKSPLGLAGFEVGDMILEINGQEITGIDTFVEMVGTLQPNQPAALLALDHKTGNRGTIQVKAR
ncbi:MAG: hypothetical protein C0392_13685 [Syntrophus sp. (in: bacteria)]|nr:hypothetical protein [Syntrophus sp. (in: bacteria)]